MAEHPSFLLLRPYLWLPASEGPNLLGAIVKNFRAPTDNSYPSRPDKYAPTVVENVFDNFVMENDHNHNRDVSADLGNVAGASFFGYGGAALDLHGKRISYKRLKNHDEYMEKMKKDAEVQRWVPDWIRAAESPVCMVTGLFFCEDVVVARSADDKRRLIADAQVPLGYIARTATGVQMPFPFRNPGADGSDKQFEHCYFTAANPNKSIFAIGVKIVTTNWRRDLVLTEQQPDMSEDHVLDDDEIDINELQLFDLTPAERAFVWEDIPEQ